MAERQFFSLKMFRLSDFCYSSEVFHLFISESHFCCAERKFEASVPFRNGLSLYVFMMYNLLGISFKRGQKIPTMVGSACDKYLHKIFIKYSRK